MSRPPGSTVALDWGAVATSTTIDGSGALVIALDGDFDLDSADEIDAAWEAAV